MMEINSMQENEMLKRYKNANRKVQGMPQSQAAATLWYQEEEKKDTNERVQNKQTDVQETHRPALSFPGEVIKSTRK